MTGTSTMMTQAPWVNFVIAMMTSTTSDRNAPMPLTNEPVAPARLLVRDVVLGHAGLRQREADVNTPIA